METDPILYTGKQYKYRTNNTILDINNRPIVQYTMYVNSTLYLMTLADMRW